MAKRPANPRELPDALREAVERTVESTLGSAGRSREAAQGALDDVVTSVEDLRRGAEQRLARGRRSMAGAIEGRRPATSDDLREVKAGLRAISRRLDAIEERLPAKRAPAQRARAKKRVGAQPAKPAASAKKRVGAQPAKPAASAKKRVGAKPSAAKRTTPKRSPSKRSS